LSSERLFPTGFVHTFFMSRLFRIKLKLYNPTVNNLFPNWMRLFFQNLYIADALRRGALHVKHTLCKNWRKPHLNIFL
jgi:hypothetical protein